MSTDLLNYLNYYIKLAHNKFILKMAKKAMEKLAKISIDEEIDPTISIGDYVLIKGLETKGTVSNVKGNKISVINEDGFTINTN